MGGCLGGANHHSSQLSLLPMDSLEASDLLQPSDHHPPPPPPVTFVEVTCKTSGKTRRFAAGTKAGFALDLINWKLGVDELPPASYIDAVKVGEEPISFGPTAVLTEYGNGWKLQTVTAEGFGKDKRMQANAVKQYPPIMTEDGFSAAERSMNGLHRPDESKHIKRSINKQKSVISSIYIGKIMLALVLIFLLGTFFTLFLESLPSLILYVTSSV